MPREASSRRKVLILVYSLERGGAERMSTELARSWSDQGFEVVVVTIAAPSRDFFRLDSRVRRIHLEGLEGVGSVKVNVDRVRAIRRLLIQERPDAAIGMMSPSAILLALAGAGLSIRTFGSERTYPPMIPLGWYKERLRWLSYGLLTGVIGQTRAAAQWLQQNTLARRIHVIPNHIDLPLGRQEPIVIPDRVLPAHRRMILAVGRMTEEKQFPLMIELFSEVANRFPKWDLVIAGDGPDRDLVQGAVVRANLSKRVHLVGAAGNIGDWHARAELFLMTSRFEGFPNALLEAMAHGTPPLAFDCMTGPGELISDGTDGRLVPLNDAHRYVSALTDLLSSSGQRRRMGQAARTKATLYNGNRVMDLWNDALGLRQD